jgi:hypothetical protein
MMALGGRGSIALLIFDLGTRWGWVVKVTPRPRFKPGESTPGTHCTGGWVGTRAGLDTDTRGKILCLCRGWNPDRPVRSQTLYWLSYPAPTPASKSVKFVDLLSITFSLHPLLTATRYSVTVTYAVDWADSGGCITPGMQCDPTTLAKRTKWKLHVKHQSDDSSRTVKGCGSDVALPVNNLRIKFQ